METPGKKYKNVPFFDAKKEKLNGCKTIVYLFWPDKFNFKKDNTTKYYHWRDSKGHTKYFLQPNFFNHVISCNCMEIHNYFKIKSLNKF